MDVSPRTQAVMLLTLFFRKSGSQDAKPLSNREWSHLAIWLREHNLDPSALLKEDLKTTLTGWSDRSVTISRLQALLDRGAALGLALEKWQRAGLWVLTRSDPEYPGRIKKRLGGASPAVLFGCGNKNLLNSIGMAVVGSRDASEEDLAFTRKLGQQIAENGYMVVSGGARGVDEISMQGALEGEGTAIGVLADSLLKSTTSSRFRNGIMSGSLTLVSPFNPEAGFNVGNAMSRNRYIYCLSDAAVVISSTLDRGGTWNGAIEDLEAAWVPLWVKQTSNRRSGNPELVRRGAKWLPDDPSDVSAWLNGSGATAVRCSQNAQLPAYREQEQDPEEQLDVSPPPASPSEAPTDNFAEPPKPPLAAEAEFYWLFIMRLGALTQTAPMKLEDLASHLDLETSQLLTWLKRGSSEGKVTKLTRPVRYRATSAEPQKSLAFGDDL